MGGVVAVTGRSAAPRLTRDLCDAAADSVVATVTGLRECSLHFRMAADGSATKDAGNRTLSGLKMDDGSS